MAKGFIDGALSALLGRDSESATAAESVARTTEPHCFDREDEYDYPHYLPALDDVAALRAAGRTDEAEALGLWCVEYAEAEQSVAEGVPEWGDLPVAVYREVADLYRDRGERRREREICQRYVTGQERLDAPVESEIRDRLEDLAATPDGR